MPIAAIPAIASTIASLASSAASALTGSSTPSGAKYAKFHLGAAHPTEPIAQSLPSSANVGALDTIA